MFDERGNNWCDRSANGGVHLPNGITLHCLGLTTPPPRGNFILDDFELLPPCPDSLSVFVEFALEHRHLGPVRFLQVNDSLPRFRLERNGAIKLCLGPTKAQRRGGGVLAVPPRPLRVVPGLAGGLHGRMV